jgi:hypothetical protein
VWFTKQITSELMLCILCRKCSFGMSNRDLTILTDIIPYCPSVNARERYERLLSYPFPFTVHNYLCNSKLHEICSWNNVSSKVTDSSSEEPPVLVGRQYQWVNNTIFEYHVALIYDSQSLASFFKRKSGALVRQRTIPTERPPHVGEVSDNFFNTI